MDLLLVKLSVFLGCAESRLSLFQLLHKAFVYFRVALNLPFKVCNKEGLFVNLLVECALSLSTLDQTLLHLHLRISLWSWCRSLSGLLKL